jgi:hypothetical protein
MSTIYRGPCIDASYQVSVHLTKRFQRRRFLKHNPQKIAYGGQIVNRLGRNEQSLQASTLTNFSTCPFGQLTKKSTCPTQSFSCPKKLIKITKN